MPRKVKATGPCDIHAKFAFDCTHCRSWAQQACNQRLHWKSPIHDVPVYRQLHWPAPELV